MCSIFATIKCWKSSTGRWSSNCRKTRTTLSPPRSRAWCRRPPHERLPRKSLRPCGIISIINKGACVNHSLNESPNEGGLIMFGILETEQGIPTLDDPAVREAVAKANRTRIEVEKLEADEARLLRVLHPAPNAPDPGEDARQEAMDRLHVARGTQSGWYLPELKTAREAHKLALAELTAARG